MAATNDSRFLSYNQYEALTQRLSKVTVSIFRPSPSNSFTAELRSEDGVQYSEGVMTTAGALLGSWTHPTATAMTLTTANQVIKSLTVDDYGHVTAATQAALVAADIPNLAASKINSGTFGVARGGTGLSTWTGAYRIIYSTAATTVTTLAPNTTATKKFLSMTGTGSAGQAPAWSALAATDIPDLAWSKITSGKPTTLSGYGIADAKIEAVTGGDKITLGSNNITVADWAQGTGTKVSSSALPALYIGTTAVSATSGAVTTLVGVTGFNPNSGSTCALYFDDSIGNDGGWEFDSSLDIVDRLYIGGGDNPYLYWDSTNNAWHLTCNFIADGYVSAGGVSSTGGGGGGGSDLNALRDWTNYNATDTGQVLGSNLGKGLADRISDLEQRATNVSFTQAVTSGETLGTITIDGTSKTIVAPLAVTSISLVTASGTNQHKLQINTRNASHSTTASYVDLPSVFAKLASPSLTGTPTAPTATAGTNSTQIATTAFVTTAVANAIAGVTQFTSEVSWNGTSTPVVANIPAGVVVTYNGTNYTGTKATGDAGKIYLVYHSHGTSDVYDEYMYLNSAWEKIGNTDIDLSNYWNKTDLVAITAAENTTLLNTYFPIPA